MSNERPSVASQALLFLLGAAVGAAAVALLTPKSGPELRAELKKRARALREALEGESEEI